LKYLLAAAALLFSIGAAEAKGHAWFLAHSHRPGGCNAVAATYYDSGRRTASGEAFRPDGVTAAHKTLPFGTRLTVHAPDTGRSVTVRINDRGPFVRGYALDLSRGAMRQLGSLKTRWVCIA